MLFSSANNPQTSNAARGDVNSVNLRSLGVGNTLVLLNGRRVGNHGASGKAVDLNSIPLAAIERIEILSDGASAIYGSDALGGVVNIILRKDFEGGEVRYGRGNPAVRGGDTGIRAGVPVAVTVPLRARSAPYALSLARRTRPQ